MAGGAGEIRRGGGFSFETGCYGPDILAKGEVRGYQLKTPRCRDQRKAIISVLTGIQILVY